MPDLWSIDGVLWSLAAVGTIWALVPPVVTALGLYRASATAREDTQAAPPSEDGREYLQKYRELSELGFRPVGLLTEHYWLFAFHWYKEFSSRCLATADNTYYASLYRFFDGPVRVKFDSFLSDGFIVRTVMGEDCQDRDDRWVRTEVPTKSVIELFEQHKQLVEELAGERGTGLTASEFQDWARIDEEWGKETVQRNAGLAVFLLLAGVIFAVPGALVLLGGYLLGGIEALPRSAAVALCAGTVCHLVLLKILVPMAARGELEFVKVDTV
jgi:hypothetical protein